MRKALTCLNQATGCLFLLLGLVLAPTVADAGPITFTFAGTVTQDPLLDPDDPFGGTIAFGTPFSGSYVFESTTPDGDPSANGGSYTSAGGSLTLTIGGQTFLAADLLNIGVGNNFSGSDFYTVFAQSTGGPDLFDISLMLQDLNATVFGSAAAPDRRAAVLRLRACHAGADRNDCRQPGADRRATHVADLHRWVRSGWRHSATRTRTHHAASS